MRSADENRGQHHYALIHRVLRSLALEEPYMFFLTMADSRGTDVLKRLWTTLCEEYEGDPGFSIEEVTIRLVQVAKYPGLLIRMPPPQRIPEAHMACFVLKLPEAKILEADSLPKDPAVEYFTLEKTETDDGDPHATCLCSWTTTCHINYGRGPRAVEGEEAFLRAVERLIDRPAEDRPIHGFFTQ